MVDDVRANRELLETILGSAGYDVLALGSLAEARAAIEEREPDVIVSDFHLHGESGVELLNWVRAGAQLARTPFLFVSSTVRAEADRQTCLERGADRFLLRPIEAPVLLSHIAQCLAERGKS